MIAVLAIVMSAAQATSPCRVPGGCIDEASATFGGLIDVFERKCAEAYPDHAARYHEIAMNSFGNEDIKFPEKLRASTTYAQVVKKIELDVNRMDKRALLESCESFFGRQ